MTRPTKTQCEMIALTILLVASLVYSIVRHGFVHTLIYGVAWILAFVVITLIIAGARAMGRDR